jgi:hypothetical protein
VEEGTTRHAARPRGEAVCEDCEVNAIL